MSNVLIIGYVGCTMDEKTGLPVGMKGAGKDTAASIVSDILCEYEDHIIKMADPLKDIVSDMYCLPREVYDTVEMKEVVLKNNWSYRGLLECFGTDVARDGLVELLPNSDEIWICQVVQKIKFLQQPIMRRVIAQLCNLSYYEMTQYRRIPGTNVSFDDVENRLKEKMKALNMPEPVERPILVQITDVRMYNEYQSLKRLGAKFIQINRNIVVDQPVLSHASNIYDERMVCDVVIDNNGSFDDLRDLLKSKIGAFLS